MPKLKRFKTKYPGVYYIIGVSVFNQPERFYYIRYHKNGKNIDEPVGRQIRDNMSPAKANNIRAQKINGLRLTNQEKRKRDAEIRIGKSNRWTISRLWDEYKYRNPDLKGIVQDRNRFDKHIIEVFGNKTPSEITQTEIDIFKLKLLKTYSPATVSNILELLRRIINFGSKKQLTKGIDFTIEMPRVNNIKTEDLTSEQMKTLIKVLNTDKNRDICNIMQIALFTGMRKSEILRLEWNHIDFEKGFIKIVNPKGGKEQIIPLNKMAKGVLQNQPKQKSNYVFPAKDGSIRKNIKHPLNRIKNAAQLPSDFRPLHGLRHAFASFLASSGQVDLYTIQTLLTHKSPQMTQRYAHLRDEALKRASDIITQME